MATTRLYRDGRFASDDLTPPELAQEVRGASSFGWLDVDPGDPAALDLAAATAAQATLGTDDSPDDGPATPADLTAALDRDDRPTVRYVASHALFGLPVPTYDARSGDVSTTGLAVLLTRRLLVTAGLLTADLTSARAAWDGERDRSAGVLFLAHGVVAAYLQRLSAVVDDLDEEIQDLEDAYLDGDDAATELGVERRRARRALTRLRAVVTQVPAALDVLAEAARGADRDGYFDDLDRRADRLITRTEGMRETLVALLEVELALRGNQLNVVMRRLSAAAAIFAVVAAIAGYYGMNVRTWPAAGSTWGGVFALLLIVGGAGGAAVMFRRRGWL